MIGDRTIRMRQAPEPAGLGSCSYCARGCGTPAEKAVIPEPVAPVRPAEVKAETLPAVKFVDITKEAGISSSTTTAPSATSSARDHGLGRGVSRL